MSIAPIEWDNPDERYYMTGLDRGVLYPKVGDPVPWNGLTSLDEVGNSTKTILYRDGRIFYADVEPGDYEASLSALFYPDEFAVCAGMPAATDGLFVDNQKPQRFGLSYRTLVGSGNSGDIFGYQIHMVYQATATIGTRARKTLTNAPDLMPFTFDICAVPVKLPGMRPSAHYILDTRFLDGATLTQLELILYGDGVIAGRLPEPIELFDMMHFGSAITFIDNGDGTWTARGSSANLIDNGDGTWQILNVNGTDNGDGTFILEDTP
jgi:hypothetical protein